MTQSLEQAVQCFAPPLPLAVAFSGGADSTALLHAVASRWPGQVVALHVNHGVQSAAAQFELHCRTVCRQLGVPLRVAQVDARAQAGQSPEDAARQARYRALLTLAQQQDDGIPVASIALAQHADDQVETALLALSRGAGLGGLSAMPERWERDGLVWCRPLLGVAGGDIRAWLQQRQLAYVEDPTNQDVRFTRNHIRSVLLPALQQVFPSFRTTFARSVRHVAQGQDLLRELAALDMEQVAAGGGRMVLIVALQGLTAARQANVLRYWLQSVHSVVPSTAQLDELLRQVGRCRTRGHRVHIKVGPGFVRRQGDCLDWYN